MRGRERSDMISRRDFLQTSMAASAILGASSFGNWARLAAQQALTQDQLLQFDTFGNVSLIHITDIHAQLKPIYFREPEVNIIEYSTNVKSDLSLVDFDKKLLIYNSYLCHKIDLLSRRDLYFSKKY